jgi:hypothetical protein
MVYKELHHL